MQDLSWVSKTIRTSAAAAANAGNSRRYIKRFFKTVVDAGYNTLFILEGFDTVRKLFKGATDFEFLRDLADGNRFGLSLVLTCHRSIVDIENMAGHTPYLYNIFRNEYLGMFSEDDLKICFSRFPSTIPLSDIQERVSFYCGALPGLF